MTEHREAIDEIIDALNAGKPVAVDADPELEELVALIRIGRRLGQPDLPDADFPSRMARHLAGRLQPAHAARVTSGSRPRLRDKTGPALGVHADPPRVMVDQIRRRQRWLREVGKLVAGVAVLLVLAGMLMTMLDGRRDQAGMPPAAGQPGWATPEGSTPAPVQSVFELDPGAQQARDAGRGRDVSLSQSAHGFTLTIDWVGADANRIMLAYTVSGPPGHVFSNFSFFEDGRLKTANGMSLPLGGGVVSGVPGETAHYLEWWDASVITEETGDLALRLETSGIQGVELVPPGATPLSAQIGTPAAEPWRESQPYVPAHSVYIQGPFRFDFSVPLADGWQAPAIAGTPGVTLEQAAATVRAFLGDPQATLDGKLVDVPPPPSNNPSPTDPSVMRYVFTRTWQVGAEPDAFVVDAETGEIVEAVLPSGAAAEVLPRRVSEDEATRIAEDFALAHLPDFERYQLASRVPYPLVGGLRSPIGDPRLRLPKDVLYVQWQEQPASKEYPAAAVGVDLRTGQVVSYQIGRFAMKQPTPIVVASTPAS